MSSVLNAIANACEKTSQLIRAYVDGKLDGKSNTSHTHSSFSNSVTVTNPTYPLSVNVTSGDECSIQYKNSGTTHWTVGTGTGGIGTGAFGFWTNDGSKNALTVHSNGNVVNSGDLIVGSGNKGSKSLYFPNISNTNIAVLSASDSHNDVFLNARGTWLYVGNTSSQTTKVVLGNTDSDIAYWNNSYAVPVIQHNEANGQYYGFDIPPNRRNGTYHIAMLYVAGGNGNFAVGVITYCYGSFTALNVLHNTTGRTITISSSKEHFTINFSATNYGGVHVMWI